MPPTHPLALEGKLVLTLRTILLEIPAPKTYANSTLVITQNTGNVSFGYSTSPSIILTMTRLLICFAIRWRRLTVLPLSSCKTAV
jgi:hypothetical protein